MKKSWMNGLKFQITAFYIVASLMTVLLIGFILYYSVSNVVLRETLNSTEMAVEKSGTFIESYIDKIKDNSLLIAKHPSTVRYLSSENNSDDIDNIKAMIDQSLEADPYIASVIIVGKSGQLISNETSLDMSMSDDMMKEPWYVNVVEGDGMPALTSARMQKFSMDKDEWVISLSRQILNDQGMNIGVMVVDFKYQVIEDYLNALDLGQEGYAYILNSVDGVVYHEDTSYFEDQVKQAELIKMSQMQEGYDPDLNLLVRTYEFEKADWVMTGVASLDGLNVIRRQMIETILFIGLIGMGVLVVASVYFASRITNPIARLERAMSDVEDGLRTIEVEQKACNEAISLSEHYNEMVIRIKELMKDVAEQEKAIRSYELNVLHSQINPHFLYNTLDTIVWMAEFGDGEKVVHVTKALAQFFRLSLSGGSEETTLANEIDHVRQYLFIQKERYQEQLNYSIEAEGKLDDIKVPKIILQPIVENAIYHGIRDLEYPGKIDMTIREKDEDIIIMIRDNGQGFDPKKLEDQNPKKKVKLGGVGVKNVDQRLKLTYGEGYGLKVESKIGEGTVVTLKIHK